MQYLFFLPFCPFWLEKKSKSICRRNIILGKVKNETLLVIFKHTVKSGDACLTSNGRNNPRGIKQYFALYFMTGGIYVLKLVLAKTLVIYYYLMKR